MCALIVQNSIISQGAMRITSRMALPPPLTADPVIPLWNAAEKHDLMLVREILTNSTNTSELVNRLHPLSKTTPLMAACIRRDMSHKYPDYSAFQIVELLVKYGADVRPCDESVQGNTALHYAAASDQVRTAELLLRMGADPFALNNRGHAPIDITCWFEKGRVRDLLMEDIRVKQGWMYVKKSSQHRWRKRFCIVLACDSTRSVLEFKILRSPAEFNPSAVIVFRLDEVKMVELPAETGTFSKKTNLFAFEHPVVVHEQYTQESFSRRTALEEGAGKLTAFEFATDDTFERDAWLELFRGNQRALQPTLQHLLLPTRVQPEIMPGEEVNSPSEAVMVQEANIPDGRYDSILTEQVECTLCMTANRDAVCVPCGHVAGCFDCLNRHALTSKKCPICRSNVQDIMKVYL